MKEKKKWKSYRVIEHKNREWMKEKNIKWKVFNYDRNGRKEEKKSFIEENWRKRKSESSIE